MTERTNERKEREWKQGRKEKNGWEKITRKNERNNIMEGCKKKRKDKTDKRKDGKE